MPAIALQLFHWISVSAHLVVQHIPAHWQCGLRFWNTNFVASSFWNEQRKTFWQTDWQFREIERKTNTQQKWWRIAWGSCWWRRRRGWRRGHTPSGRATAPWSPRQTSLQQVSLVRSGSFSFPPGLSVFSRMILFTTDGVATCCTKNHLIQVET